MKLLFLTGTRADYGKIKSLIDAASTNKNFEPSIFITGMHMLSLYGSTHQEVSGNHAKEVPTYKFINQNIKSTMDEIVSKTVLGLSDFVKENRPDYIIIHGDRVETLSGVIVAALNNIPSVHIEGGEVSGTVDEMIRHSVSKLANFHCVSNEEAKTRLLQMGESTDKISIIGSPDIDIMLSNSLPDISEVKSHYGINFDEYGVLLFHPVTTEAYKTKEQITSIIEGINKTNKKFVVIYPNNDLGSQDIISAYERLSKNFRVIPSMRFEYFVTLLKKANLILGNSSAGVREAPYFGIPTINIGSRQNERSNESSVLDIDFNNNAIEKSINQFFYTKFPKSQSWGGIGTSERFLSALEDFDSKSDSTQKIFINL
jgi:UDP-N-acetylglucosamine 2-epimerase (hydrolysing)